MAGRGLLIPGLNYHILRIDIFFGVQNDEDFHVQDTFQDPRPIETVNDFKLRIMYGRICRQIYTANSKWFESSLFLSTIVCINCQIKLYECTLEAITKEIPERNCENINIELRYIIHIVLMNMKIRRTETRFPRSEKSPKRADARRKSRFNPSSLSSMYDPQLRLIH